MREQLLDSIQSGRNRLNFALRNFLSWPGPLYQEPAESLEVRRQLFADDPAARQKALQLAERYELNRLNAATVERVQESLAYLEWLDVMAQAYPDAFSEFGRIPNPRWVDVGAKNWVYVEALDAFIRAHTQNNYRLDGVELDPNRRYLDLRTRRQYAEAFIRELPQAHYHGADIFSWHQPAHVISHFLPFVVKNPLLAWGLPERFFQPRRMLLHLLALLEPGGLLIIINQGPEEAEAQHALLAEAAGQFPLQIRSMGQLPDTFIHYRYPRYGFLIRKEQESDADQCG